MKWFTSDWHMYSDFVIDFERRPFENGIAMSQALLDSVNSLASPNDTLFILGDFCDYKPDNKLIWEKAFDSVTDIGCSVELILGNNEYRLLADEFNGNSSAFETFLLSKGLKAVHHSLDIGISGIDLHLNHFPSGTVPNKFNLFGHTHRSGGLYHPNGMNVGVDMHYFKPLSEVDIQHYYIRHKEYWSKDYELHLNLEPCKAHCN